MPFYFSVCLIQHDALDKLLYVDDMAENAKKTERKRQEAMDRAMDRVS